MNDNDIRADVAEIPVPEFSSPAFTQPPPLPEARVAVVTTAGLHLPDQPGWTRREQSFRAVPDQLDGLVLGHLSPNYDRSGFIADPNVVIPLERLHERARDGRIGSVSPTHISFMGAQDETMSTIRMDSGPAAAKILRDVKVDVVLLTPV